MLRDVLAERAPLAEAHRSVDGLARLAEGKSADNRLRMSLSGYVLAARLEQVAVSASERLCRMSSGRYQLVHTAEPGAGRARGGLHLRVLDAWTGVERDPASPVRRRDASPPRWPSPSGWPTSSPARPAAPCWRRCSSTRASAASTTTPSTR